jgi:hypothetical protein
VTEKKRKERREGEGVRTGTVHRLETLHPEGARRDGGISILVAGAAGAAEQQEQEQQEQQQRRRQRTRSGGSSGSGRGGMECVARGNSGGEGCEAVAAPSE